MTLTRDNVKYYSWNGIPSGKNFRDLAVLLRGFEDVIFPNLRKNNVNLKLMFPVLLWSYMIKNILFPGLSLFTIVLVTHKNMRVNGHS